MGQLPFGAVAVDDTEVIAVGVDTTLQDEDPNAHAKVTAIRAACTALGTLPLDGAIIYTSCEP